MKNTYHIGQIVRCRHGRSMSRMQGTIVSLDPILIETDYHDGPTRFDETHWQMITR